MYLYRSLGAYKAKLNSLVSPKMSGDYKTIEKYMGFTVNAMPKMDYKVRAYSI